MSMIFVWSLTSTFPTILRPTFTVSAVQAEPERKVSYPYLGYLPFVCQLLIMFIHFPSILLGVAVSFFVAEKNGRMAKDMIEILNRTDQVIPNELRSAAMSSRGGGGRGRGRGRY